LTTARNEHAELKERAKLVATELKERRVECRELHGKLEDMDAEHVRLQREIEALKDQLSHQGLNQSEKDGEMDSLRSQLVRAQEIHKTAEREWKDREVKHEQALSDYKKKAQHSLSMANSRTAAAVQAREEAELDARAARSTADSAFERATAAELSSRESVAEAKAALRAMERERDEIRAKMTEMMEAKTKVDVELAAVQAKLNQSVASRDKQGIELEAMRADLRAEQGQSASLQHQITEIEAIKKKYQAEIDSLNIQLEGTKRALEAVDKGRDSTSEVYSVNAETFTLRSDDGAVTALRQELREANDSIQYLKDALKNAVEMNEKSAGQSNGGADSHPEHAEEQNDGIPLFYAMEKQAELKTARAEINRLANELANLQSDKSEAVESMNEMRQRMEESEARLKRFEKLSGTDDGGVPTSQNGNTPAQANRAVNIEYLKHIMLKYITAKTTTERKALVPVIGAVLELTSAELTKALASVEQTASASSSFFGLM
jgi:chromosome segregation ATPase